MTRAVAKLNIDCPTEKQEAQKKSKLDERFLQGMRAADLSLQAIKDTLVATERHLWLNLSGIWEKYRAFLVDA